MDVCYPYSYYSWCVCVIICRVRRRDVRSCLCLSSWLSCVFVFGVVLFICVVLIVIMLFVCISSCYYYVYYVYYCYVSASLYLFSVLICCVSYSSYVSLYYCYELSYVWCHVCSLRVCLRYYIVLMWFVRVIMVVAIVCVCLLIARNLFYVRLCASYVFHYYSYIVYYCDVSYYCLFLVLLFVLYCLLLRCSYYPCYGSPSVSCSVVFLMCIVCLFVLSCFIFVFFRRILHMCV